MADPAAAAAATADSGAVVPAGNREAWTPRFGDMVWGKVKSHPWWPGHVYSITLSDDPEVHRGHREGLVLVAFFGDGSYGWFEPHELVRFEDHFVEKTSQGGSRTFPGAVTESLDEIARRSALALLCPCRGPETFRPHNEDPRFLLVNVPGFDCNAEYLPDQVTAARERIVPRTMLDFLHNAAVEQRDAAETAARTLPGIELAAMLMGYRRSRFERYDITYAESFGVEAEKALQAEKKAEAERSDRARPLKGRQRVPLPEKENQPSGRGRRGAAGAAARLMEKIMPGAPAMKPRASKKDQYLLKRRDDARPAPALAMAPAVLPDAAAPALDDGVPPGFPQADPQTPPLPGSAADEEEFLLQRRAVPPVVADQASEGGVTADPTPSPKKVAKPKKVRKREREEPVDAAAGAAAAAADEPKKKKKKKKQLAELNVGMVAAAAAATSAPSGSGAKPAALSPPKVDLDGVDLKQVISDLQKLPLLPSYGAGRQISDASHSFVLAFRSKYFKKSHENDPPEESKKSLENRPSSADSAAAAGGQPPKPAKKKPPMRPSDPTKSGVKRGPSDRQEELAAKKKTKLDKIKTLASDKKAALEQKESAAAAATAGGAPAAQQPRAGMKEKPLAAAKKKVPAAPAPAKRTASPTALMMKFPLKSTLPSVASLKARFARFGPLDIDGIRVYWKSHMCRVIYRFQSDAEVALKYAKANAMFGQVLPNYYLRGIESDSAGGGDPGLDVTPPQQRSDLRLMETAPFRPGSSGNGAPLALSRAAPARAAVGQQPKSILKKNSDDGAAGASLRYSPRVKFMLDDADTKLEPPALPASGAGSVNALDSAAAAAVPVSKSARSVGFATPLPAQPPVRPVQQPHLQPPMRPQQQPLQPPRPQVTQPFPPMPQQQHLPYQPRINDGPPAFTGQPSPYAPRQYTDALPSFSAQQPPYQPRHSDGLLAHPGQPQLLQYPPRQHYPPHSSDMPPPRTAYFPGHGHDGIDTPAWKRGEKEFREELMRVMLGIAKLVEPLMDKNGNFPYHLFGRSA